MFKDIQISKSKARLAGEGVHLPVDNKNKNQLISKHETARLLGGEDSPLSISYINVLLARKELPKVRLSYRLVRIPKQAVLDFIAKRTVNQRGALK